MECHFGGEAAFWRRRAVLERWSYISCEKVAVVGNLPHKHEALAAYCVRAISHCICTTKLILQGGVPTCDLDTHLAYNVGTRVYT